MLRIITCQAAGAGVKVYNLAVNGNHIHSLVRASTRRSLHCFLRAVAGQLARLVTGATRGNAVGKFWHGLTFSKMIEWGKDFRGAQDYVPQNALEADGVIAYRPRINRVGRSALRFKFMT